MEVSLVLNSILLVYIVKETKILKCHTLLKDDNMCSTLFFNILDKNRIIIVK